MMFSFSFVLAVVLVMVDVGVGGESDGCGGGRDTSWKILLSHLYVFCYIDQMGYKLRSDLLGFLSLSRVSMMMIMMVMMVTIVAQSILALVYDFKQRGANAQMMVLCVVDSITPESDYFNL